MTNSQQLELKRSKVRSRLSAISLLQGDDYSNEIQTEEQSLQVEYGELEVRQRSAIISESEELEVAKTKTGNGVDAETRERQSLRSKARLTNYLTSAARGRLPDGPEAELAQAAGVGGIPIELFEPPANGEQRAVSPAPGIVGVNLDVIRPHIFAQSVVARLGVDMPMVPSGSYATATISRSVTAGARDKSADAPASAAALTVTQATPKRISTRLELTLEDIAAVGQENFESILRQNLMLALSDELDDQALNGDGNAPNLAGIFQRLTDPGDPGAGIVDFDDFIEAYASGVDGLWAAQADQVSLVVNPLVYRAALQTFRDAAGQDLGGESAADYAMEHFGGFWTNERMPAEDANISQAILYRMGRSAMGASAGMRTAVLPHWGEISVDDIFSGSIKGERYFSMHVLLGDVILVQPAAYAQVAFRSSV